MKQIPLTCGLVALVDDEDYPMISQFKWHVQQTRVLYAVRRFGETKQYMHRMILGLTDRKDQVDHIDFDGLNNQKSNLRLSTPSQNQAHKIKQSRKGGSDSRFKGVTKYKKTFRNPWQARIIVDKKVIYLGRFTSELEAAKAYNTAAKIHFGSFAIVNHFDE